MFHDKIVPYISGEGREGGLLANPMFNAGMGLLSSRMDNNINPFLAGMKGLASAKEQEVAAEKRKRDEEMRRSMEAFFSMQGPQQPQQQQLLGPISEPPPQQPGLAPVPPPQGPFQGQMGMAPVSPQGLNLDMVSPITADLMRRYSLMNIGR